MLRQMLIQTHNKQQQLPKSHCALTKHKGKTKKSSTDVLDLGDQSSLLHSFDSQGSHQFLKQTSVL